MLLMLRTLMLRPLLLNAANLSLLLRTPVLLLAAAAAAAEHCCCELLLRNVMCLSLLSCSKRPVSTEGDVCD